MLAFSLLSAVSVAGLVAAQTGVVGSASGFASGVTGGGDATPAVPADIDELVSWLTDDEPRVILLDKEYNFLESEGTTTENGCRPDSNTCGSKGQDALDGPNWCSASYPTVEVTYDVAATKPIDIKSNKSIVGVGDKGVVRGKGFRVVSGAENIIFQNFHITELNPQYIWGGDAIQMSGSDLIWIDHMKFSLIGRQFLVTGYESAGRVTISNSELDGETSWSASCNGEHYWTMLLIGENDKITLANNWIHNTSGRSPKVGTTTTLHAVNNFFDTNGGHNFDVEEGAKILIEGNVFQDCKAPVSAATLKLTSGLFNVPTAGDAASCSAALGRDCQINSLSGSGDFGSFTDTAAVEAVGSADAVWKATSADDVTALKTSAGVGKLSSSASGNSAAAVVEAKAVSSASPSSSSVSPSSAPSSTQSSSSATATTFVTASATSAQASATASSTAPAASAEESDCVVEYVTASSAAAKETGVTAASDSASVVARYGRCGGIGYAGATSCAEGSSCSVVNDWYSQCV